jgi:hypothetical protein
VVQYSIGDEATERYLAASETAKEGGSGDLPILRKGEFVVPVGRFTANSFIPVKPNDKVSGRVTFCIGSGINLPPELADVLTCD